MLDQFGHAVVGEAGGEAFGQPDGPVGLVQQQRTGVRGDGATVETGHHGAAFDGWKSEPCGSTVCRHWGVLWIRERSLSQHECFRISAPMHPIR